MMHLKYNRSRNAFSMVEVIVAAVLFAVASAGIFATISYTNRSIESNTRVRASVFSKKILDQLNREVSAATWNTGGLSVGNHNVAADPDFTGCTASYVVSNVSSTRKVVLTVDCP